MTRTEILASFLDGMLDPVRELLHLALAALHYLDGVLLTWWYDLTRKPGSGALDRDEIAFWRSIGVEVVS